MDKSELLIIEEILKIGLSKAAESLSFFAKSDVYIDIIDFDVSSNIKFNSISKTELTNGRNFLLKTEIKGEIRGESYLIFNEIEADKITGLNISISDLSTDDKKDMISNFLLEVDNIVTASVITQFSNILKCKIHGDVPSIIILDRSGINNFLVNDHNKDFNFIKFSVNLKSDNINIYPEFIWFMDFNFFDRIKNISGK